ncbi:XdhC family protein [Actinomycetospora chiangmaiensis]|uniref:XdhC family protein n=1 Tax=Actinomycetospora chiangmaiensis TaxID=402650 RepID=UPI0003646E01|nr:XdhC family protein [Actinomycetospora chiangmaiensis]
MSTLLGRAEALREAGTPFVLATVVRVERPTSARPGDRALVLGDGTIDGFVGGHCAEGSVRAEGLRVLAERTSTVLRISPEGDDGGCRGSVAVNHCPSGGMLEILLEAVVPATTVAVHGTGPIAAALRRLATALDHRVVAVGEAADAVVVAAHGDDETPVLEAALRAGVPYVGLIASRRRGATVLAALDVDEADRARVHTPAGLDIGAATPSEVALAVLAEVVATRDR